MREKRIKQYYLSLEKYLLCLGLVSCLSLMLTGSAWAAEIDIYLQVGYEGSEYRVQLLANTHTNTLASAGVKLGYLPSELSIKEVQKVEEVWCFSDGKAISPYVPPDTSTSGEVVFILGAADLSNPDQGVSGEKVPLGRVVFESKVPSPSLTFTLSLAKSSGTYSNFVSRGGTTLDGQVNFNPVVNIGPVATGGNVFLSGDANADGTIGQTDITIIEQYQESGQVHNEWMDCDGDGDLDAQDIACIGYIIKNQ